MTQSKFILKFFNMRNHRYYNLMLEQDLLGDWIIILNRGGLFKNHEKRFVVHSYIHCFEFIKQFSKTRIAHGYELI